MRRPLIAGNWKMHNTVSESMRLVKALKVKTAGIRATEIVVCPPYTALKAVSDIIADSEISLGAQNMYYEEVGAYTGAVSPTMLKDAGCEYVILGHSERRAIFGEKDWLVARKLSSAHKHGLLPIVCVGETIEEREGGRTEQVVARQVEGSILGIGKDEILRTTIAYEPVWAIGTGRTASPGDAGAVHGFIRRLLAGRYGEETAETVRILYGGSVKPSNAEALLSEPDIDGALVGGASLKADDFAAIIKSAEEKA